jgi:hypothetical protein
MYALGSCLELKEPLGTLVSVLKHMETRLCWKCMGMWAWVRMETSAYERMRTNAWERMRTSVVMRAAPWVPACPAFMLGQAALR